MVSDDEAVSNGMVPGDDAVRALFAQAPEGPPLGLDAAGLIARGAKIRRRRKRWAVAASSAATVAVLVAAGLAVGNRETAPSPVMPAGPGLATVSPAPETASPVPDQLPAPDQEPGAPENTGTSGRIAPTGRPGAPRTSAAWGAPILPPRVHPTTTESVPLPGSTKTSTPAGR